MIPNPAAVAAARNNAEWCAAVCRSHGVDGSFGDAAWTSSRRTPPFYPDAVTLHGGAVPADVLPRIDTTAGCSVKDSFAALDLAADGFAELFTAQWIRRGAAPPPPSDLRAEPVRSAAALREWQAAWHGSDDPPDVFRPALLDDPAVLVLTVLDGATHVGGAVLNHHAGVVGVSNLFGLDPARLWGCVIGAATESFPGVDLVGYEGADDLPPALDSGFTAIGTLRVWVKG